MSTCTMVRGPASWPTAVLRRPARETDAGRHRGQGGDDEGDVLVEIHAELLGAAVDVLPIHRAREAFVLELLPHRRRLEAGNDAPGADKGARGDEAGQLITRVETTLEQGEAGIAGGDGARAEGPPAVRGRAARAQGLRPPPAGLGCG